jgi:spermidine synthase
MGPPVLLAGASYPFIQAIVTDRTESVGRRTGLILAANVAGNVAGTLLTGYVLIDRFGTSGTLRLLTASLVLAGVAALALDRRPTRATVASVAGIAALGGFVVAAPDNERLWAFLHGTSTDRLTVAEQRSCATTLKRGDGGEEILHINGSSQNGYPFDDFHVLIGLLPALAHPQPERALAIGLGIGATAYGMAVVPEVGSVDVVELCGGQYTLLDGLAAGGAPELQRLFADRDVHRHVADGRKFLLTADDSFDLITVDTLRPQSAFSGSLYSTDFYELLRDKLAPGGIVAQWAPTARVRNSITAVFPHVVGVSVASYGGSSFLLASEQPVTLDPAVLAARVAALPAGTFSPAQEASLRAFVGAARGDCVADGPPATRRPRWSINRDLAPRDEYFLNNPLDVADLTGCSGPGSGGNGDGGQPGRKSQGPRRGAAGRAAAGAA